MAQEAVEDGPEKERKNQGRHQPGLEPLKHPGDTAVCFHSVCVLRMRTYSGLPELSIPMMLHAVSIEMRFQLVRPEVDAV